MLPTCDFAVALSAASPTRVGNVVAGVAAEVVTVVARLDVAAFCRSLQMT